MLYGNPPYDCSRTGLQADQVYPVLQLRTIQYVGMVATVQEDAYQVPELVPCNGIQCYFRITCRGYIIVHGAEVTRRIRIAVEAESETDFMLEDIETGVYWIYARDSSLNILQPDSLVIMNTTGVYQSFAENLRIYPNPTNTSFTLNFENSIQGE
jgi:hypothetical protein